MKKKEKGHYHNNNNENVNTTDNNMIMIMVILLTPVMTTIIIRWLTGKQKLTSFKICHHPASMSNCVVSLCFGYAIRNRRLTHWLFAHSLSLYFLFLFFRRYVEQKKNNYSESYIHRWAEKEQEEETAKEELENDGVAES